VLRLPGCLLVGNFQQPQEQAFFATIRPEKARFFAQPSALLQLRADPQIVS